VSSCTPGSSGPRRFGSRRTDATVGAVAPDHSLNMVRFTLHPARRRSAVHTGASSAGFNGRGLPRACFTMAPAVASLGEGREPPSLETVDAVRLLQPAVPTSAGFTAPLLARPDPGGDEFCCSSVSSAPRGAPSELPLSYQSGGSRRWAGVGWRWAAGRERAFIPLIVPIEIVEHRTPPSPFPTTLPFTTPRRSLPARGHQLQRDWPRSCA
jgi:hypothetical protein